MGDYHVRMAYDIDADPAAVRAALDTTAGIGSWWNDKIVGAASAEGDEFTLTFEDSPAPFELRVATMSVNRIEWFVAANPPWWAGTTIRFDIAQEGAGTKLLFEHRDFDPESPIIPVITPAWAQFVGNLKAVAESEGAVA